jgi:phage tail sheath protein FI
MTYSRPGVYVSETLLPAPITAVGTANAAGAALGAFAKGPEAVTLVTSWYDFVKKFGGFNAAFPATFGVNQFFQNGGTELYVRRVLGADAEAATVNLPSVTSEVNVGTATAKNKGAEGNNIRVRISKVNSGNLYNVTVYEEVLTSEVGTNDANGANDLIVETFNNVVFDDPNSSDYVASVVNALSSYIVIAMNSGVTDAPAVQSVSSVLPLTGGDDGDAPIAADYSDLLPLDGSSEFDELSRPLVLFAPEAYAKFVVDGLSGGDELDELVDLHSALVDYANATTGFAIIDTAPSLSVPDAISYISSVGNQPTSQAAGYYPNYFIQDPLSRNRGTLRKVAPASAVAGLYLSSDKAVGPFKAPAGVNSTVRGAVALERPFTPADLDSLNTGQYEGEGTVYGTPVNAIRQVPGAGIVVMGARTLLQDGTANRYVNTRRSLIYIKKQLENITQFAIFENNDFRLWTRLNTVIGVFLNEYRNQGGLRGQTPADAYFVKVDAENNTPESIASGQVNIEVGVALEYPAEFVVINLSQIAGN